MKIKMKLHRIYAIGSQFGGTKFGVEYSARHIGRDWFSYVDSCGKTVRLSVDKMEELFEIDCE